MKKVITKSEEETFEFAKIFAKSLKGGEIIGLSGDLGAGKTVFTKGLADGLGIKENISSPTFVYMNIYSINNNDRLKKLCHIDAYRASDSSIVDAIGAKEYFNEKEVITVIEWVEKISDCIDNNIIKIKLLIDGNNRILEIYNDVKQYE